MPNFSIPLSGLDANSQALTVIANNISNLNTAGFKSSNSSFADLFYQQLGTDGAGDPIATGSGSQIAAVTMNFNQGVLESDGVDSHAALQGSGFFVVNNQGRQLFSRDGSFSLNSQGYLAANDGSLVQGYPAVNGVINTNVAVGPLLLGAGHTFPPSPTSNVKFDMNLNSGTSIGSSFTAPIQVFDSLGGSHTLTATFTKSAANQWNYNVSIPGADVGSSSASVSVSSGTVNFTSNGDVVPTAGTSPAAFNTNINVSGLADGASNISAVWNFMDASGNSLVTQNAGPSSVTSSSQNGFASGTLQGYTIQNDGSIVGSFSNGQTGLIGQLAIASFTNVQGLTHLGSNEYAQSAGSGQANIGIAGTGGRGTVQGAALEQSNVDIAAEFSKLIQAQRGYEANAKTVTTFDQLTQDALNMKAGA